MNMKTAPRKFGSHFANRATLIGITVAVLLIGHQEVKAQLNEPAPVRARGRAPVLISGQLTVMNRNSGGEGFIYVNWLSDLYQYSPVALTSLGVARADGSPIDLSQINSPSNLVKITPDDIIAAGCNDSTNRHPVFYLGGGLERRDQNGVYVLSDGAKKAAVAYAFATVLLSEFPKLKVYPEGDTFNIDRVVYALLGGNPQAAAYIRELLSAKQAELKRQQPPVQRQKQGDPQVMAAESRIMQSLDGSGRAEFMLAFQQAMGPGKDVRALETFAQSHQDVSADVRLIERTTQNVNVSVAAHMPAQFGSALPMNPIERQFVVEGGPNMPRPVYDGNDNVIGGSRAATIAPLIADYQTRLVYLGSEKVIVKQVH